MPTTSDHRPFDEIRQDRDVRNERNIIPISRYLNKRRAQPETEADEFAGEIRELLKGTPDNEIQTFKKERDHLLSEMIFLKNRDASAQGSSARMEACDLIAADMFTLEEVISITDPEENRRLYDEISVLRTIYVNQLITLDHLVDADFEAQRGLARIELIRFLLRKADLCYRKGIELNNKNYDDRFLTDTELRLDKIQQDIRQLLKEAFAIGANDPKALEAFKSDVAALAGSKKNLNETALPTKAPELYRDRLDRREKPVDFIQRVYAPWLTKGLLRPHIKAMDEALYRALYKHGIPPSFDDLLPKAPGRALPNLSLTPDEEHERQKALARERSKRLYHKRKQAALGIS